MEIKEAKNGYLYGEAVGNTEEEALAQARSILKPAIETESRKISAPTMNWSYVMTSIVDSAQYFVKPRGNKSRVIVYLLQSDLPTLIKQYSESSPLPLPPPPLPPPTATATATSAGCDEGMIQRIKTSDDYLWGEGTAITRGKAIVNAQQELIRPVKKIMSEYEALNYDTETVEAVIYDVESCAVKQGKVFYAFAYLRQSAFHCNLQQSIISGQSSCEGATRTVVAQTPDNTREEASHQDTDSNPLSEDSGLEASSVTDFSPLMKEIISKKDINELVRDVFAVNKQKGKLAYGMLSSMTSPEESYLAVYNAAGDILTIYGKGTSERQNLNTGTMESYNEVYPDGKVIWFQLYE
ncbi:hypothetical protein FACS189430_09520 [Bacteroidia bacterium]|nr:hypothetical protein FACS189430_09520 [Bacteroidia bacterium]